jgi:hypothetical protein
MEKFLAQTAIELVFVASPLSTQHLGERAKTGWLRIRIMCQSGATCLWCPYYLPSFMKFCSVVSEELRWQTDRRTGQKQYVSPPKWGLSTQHLGERAKTGWLRIRIMCQSGATCLSMDCCFSELALSKSDSACWSSIKRTSSSFHWKLTWYIVEKLRNSLTSPNKRYKFLSCTSSGSHFRLTELVWSLTRLGTFNPMYHLLNLMIFINCTCMFTSAIYQLLCIMVNKRKIQRDSVLIIRLITDKNIPTTTHLPTRKSSGILITQFISFTGIRLVANVADCCLLSQNGSSKMAPFWHQNL